jgi:MFS family permease
MSGHDVGAIDMTRPVGFSPTEQATMGKVARRVMPLLMASYVVCYLDRVNVGFAALTMNQALGFSATVFGLGAGLFFIGYIAGEVPSNLMMQRFGGRRWIARIMITWGIASGVMAAVSGETSFYVVRFLLGLAEAGFFPGVILYVTWWFPADYRGRIIGLFLFAAPLSSVIGGPLSGAVLGLDGIGGLAGWQWLFILEALPSVLVGIAVLCFLTDRPAEASWLQPAERTWLGERLARERTIKEQTGGDFSIGKAFVHPRVWALGIAYIGGTLTNYSLFLWTPQIIKAFGGLSNFQTGLLNMIPFICGGIANIVVCRHSDIKRERLWHVVGSALLTSVGFAACALCSFLEAPVLMMVALCVAAFGSFGLVSSFWLLPTAFLVGTGAATGLALINCIGNFGGFLGPYIIGILRDLFGNFAIALLPIAVGPLVSAAIILCLRRAVADR